MFSRYGILEALSVQVSNVRWIFRLVSIMRGYTANGCDPDLSTKKPLLFFNSFIFPFFLLVIFKNKNFYHVFAALGLASTDQALNIEKFHGNSSVVSLSSPMPVNGC